jgi:hypothetical protein
VVPLPLQTVAKTQYGVTGTDALIECIVKRNLADTIEELHAKDLPKNANFRLFYRKCELLDSQSERWFLSSHRSRNSQSKMDWQCLSVNACSALEQTFAAFRTVESVFSSTQIPWLPGFANIAGSTMNDKQQFHRNAFALTVQSTQLPFRNELNCPSALALIV